MMKRLLFAMLAVGCLGASASPAYGCFCVIPELPDAFKQARAVFLGEVVGIIEPKSSNASAPTADRLFTIRFKIHRAWKGIAVRTREFNVLTAQGPGCLAFPLVRKGEKYLVYADPGDNAGNWSYIPSCGRTSVMRLGSSPRFLNEDATDAFEDIKQLDAITKRPFRFDTTRPLGRI